MYVDTCMALKLYLPEPESQIVQQRVRGERALRASEILSVELASVLARKYRNREIDARDQGRVMELFRCHVDEGHWKLIPLTSEDVTGAGELIRACQEVVGIRALDAIHLSVCRAYRSYPLFTTDPVMLKAARFMGIPTETV